MEIKVFGKGCAKCEKTCQLIKDVIDEEGAEAQVSHITDLDVLVQEGIMITPAVMVDGDLKVEGRVPKAQEIKGWF